MAKPLPYTPCSGTDMGGRRFPFLPVALLAVAGIAGNHFKLPFVFGIDFLFGSIPVLVALGLFGLFAGTIVAALAASYTYFLWGHPYAFLIFVGEALFVGLLLRRKAKNLILLDTLYWIILGMPLVMLFYHGAMQVNVTAAEVVALKQALNGIGNAAIAGILVAFAPLRKWLCREEEGHKVPLTIVLFNLLVIIALTPTFVGVVFYNGLQLAELKKEIVSRLETSSSNSIRRILAWQERNAIAVAELARVAGQSGIQNTQALQKAVETITRLSPQFYNMYVADKEAVSVAFYPPINERGESTLGMSFADRPYVQRLKATGKPVLSEMFMGRGGVFAPIMTYSVPVLNDGAFSGFALGAMNLQYVGRILKEEYTKNLETTILDSHGRVVATTKSGLQPLSLSAAEEGGKTLPFTDAVQLWVPARAVKSPPIERWRHSSFTLSLPFGESLPWRIVVEMSAAPYHAVLYAIYLKSFSAMFALVLLVLAAAMLLSRAMDRALTKISETAVTVPERISRQESVNWPESNVQELSQLTAQFRTMSHLLRDKFQELEKANKTLEDKVEERTRQLTERERRLSAVMDNTVDAIITIDEHGLICAFNNAAENIFGYKTEEVLGRNVSILMPEPFRSQHDAFIAHYLTTGIKKVIGIGREEHGIKKDGTLFPLELSVSEVVLEDQRLFTGIIRDITARKQAEEALRIAKEEAEAANRSKSDFLAGMSHEIRTPMNTILGMADLLADSPLNDEQRQYVQISRSAGENLLALINDILDLSKVEAGQVVLEKTMFDLPTLLGKACDLMRAKAEAKSLRISCAIPQTVPKSLLGDPHRLLQVLLNLVNNAIKFTEEGHIAIRVEQQDGTETGDQAVALLFSVSDTGIGIPADKLAMIFDKFTQVDSSTTRKYGGTGLGLAISKRLVELMGGRIWVASEVGRGSTFTFSAVFGTEDTATAGLSQEVPVPAADEAKAATKRPLRILLVEDNEDNQLLFLTFLKKTPHTVEIAVNGAEALEKITSGHRYDLIFMDMQMPVMDGYTASAQLREWESQRGTGRTPLVALTAHAMKEDEQKSLLAGCDGHLTKPIKKGLLLEAIEHYASA